MEKPHSPYGNEVPIDFHRERSGSINLSVISRRDDRSKSKSPHVTIPNGTGNHSSNIPNKSGHYSPNGSNSINHSSSGGNSNINGINGSTSSGTSTNGTNTGPLTKNVGVGANLNLNGRHSSASVSLGHGHLGSINGPSSVSISIGMNPSHTTAATGTAINGTSSSGRGLVGSSGTMAGTHGHGRPSHSPGLIPSTILPELLQAHAAAGAQRESSSPSSSSSRAQQGQQPPPPHLGSTSNNNSNSTPTLTKVVGSYPVKQGILGRQPRGEMSNGSTSSANKIVSQNVNGTLALTGIPTNESELQLLRVLQRANLLSYFDVMIELGGDDVQQLCEAAEEEFLEIMALIGMASKPLHVRRLQKALQEWMSNPSVFQTPVLPPGTPFGPNPSSRRASGDLVTPTPPAAHLGSLSQLPPVTSSSIPAAAHQNQAQSALPIRPIPYHSAPSAAAAMAAVAAAAQQAMFLSPSEMKSLQSKLQVMTNGQGPLGGGGTGVGSNSNSPNGGGSTSSLSSNGSLVRTSHLSPNRPSSSPSNSVSITNHSFSNGYHHHPPRSIDRLEREVLKEKEAQIYMGNTSIRIPADQIIPSHFLEQRIRTSSEPNSPAASETHSESGGSLSPIPFLQETEILKLSDVAMHTVKTLPPYVFEPLVPPKRKFSGDFELILRLPLNDPRRIDEIRKASIVYGRPDSYSSTHPNKRKMPKPLTMHEVSVNEAAAQLCKHIPALLTRRDELFALAKQVVREAGLPYSNNNFSVSLIQNNNNNNFANHNLKHKNSHLNHHHQIELNNDHRELNGGGLNGFTSKRLRLDANGIEIQEYNRPPSAHGEHTSDNDNSMQITPIRSLPRRSLSDDQSLLPLELVTVTTSSPHRSSDSGSPPSFLRRSIESDDLICNGFKITSIPVSGGLINITHDPSSKSGNSSPLKLIKSEPAN